MKTKIQYLKENIILAIIWNLPLILLITIPFVDILKKEYLIIGSIITFFYLVISSIESWYNDYRFEELEKQIKEQNKYKLI